MKLIEKLMNDLLKGSSTEVGSFTFPLKVGVLSTLTKIFNFNRKDNSILNSAKFMRNALRLSLLLSSQSFELKGLFSKP